MTTPRLGAPELTAAQALPETTVNEQIRYLESGAGHFIFKDRDLATPPGSPADGDCYLVAASPTGTWTGQAGKIAFRLNTAWKFITAIEGLTAWVNDENALIGYDGAAWAVLATPSGTYVPTAGGTMTGDLIVPAEAYGVLWNGSNEAPTKNDVYDKIETVVAGSGTITSLTGDVTASGSGAVAATIANDAVTNAKLANVATATFKGRVTAATGDPEDLTGTQATTLLDTFTTALKGLAPSSGGGTANYLRADGTWAAPTGSGATEATNSEVWTGTSATTVITPNRLFLANASVSVTYAATITLDGNTGLNFHTTLTGNATFANPTNMKAGQSGRIRITQDGTGSRTATFGVNWLFAGGDPTLSTAAGAIDVVAYYCHSSSSIEASCIKALA